MSDMSVNASHPTVSFTPRDLNRQPARVLAAARKYGQVEVRTRSGEIFTLMRKVDKKPDWPDFEARGRRLRALGLVRPSPEQEDKIDRIIAGEE